MSEDGGRRFVLATPPEGGAQVAVGPVFKASSEDKLRRELGAEGWYVGDAVAQLSAGDFRAKAKTAAEDRAKAAEQ